MFLVAMLKDTYKSSKYKEKPATIAFFWNQTAGFVCVFYNA